jgi:ABC-type branched-subunit amino acid transport system substrate-binding protein
LGVLVAGFLAMQFFGGGMNSAPPPPDDMTPVVLGIYPNEGFGIDQADGLRAAFSDTPSVMIRDLAASLDAMKGRNAPDLIEGLKTNLAQRNVIAIVGPSITEFTPEVLRVVEESGRRPAIVLTTASSRANIGWDESDLPIFRVGSGMDERADQFSRLAQNTVASGVELILLYESVPNSNDLTYGELFYQRITERLPQWQEWSDQNRVRSLSYTRGEIMDKVTLPRVRPIFDQRKMIIVVGLSTDYRELVENLYGADDGPRAALLGGWNTSKAVQQISGEMAIQDTRLFDMTDVFRSPADTRRLPDSVRFEENFGVLTPALRQEAVAYDSGLVIKQAVTQMEGEVTAERLVEILRGQRFNGITGEIAFAESGESWGQNSGQAGGMRPLYNLRYDPSATNWREIESFDALLGRVVASN